MAIIKAGKVKFEVIKQNFVGAAAKYVCKLSYEPICEASNELICMVLCSETPYVTLSEEDGSSVKTIQETGPSLTPPKAIKTPEQLFGLDPTQQELVEAYDEAITQDAIKNRLTPEDKEWLSKK